MDTAAHHPLTEYETIRARNIERNNARLCALGLISALEERHSTAAAWRRSVPCHAGQKEDRTTTTSTTSTSTTSNDEWSNDDELTEKDEENPKSRTKRKRRKSAGSSATRPRVPSSPSRKSRRLQGLTPQGGKLSTDEPYTLAEIRQERQSRIQECRLVRLRAAKAMAETAGYDTKAAKENPTATYDHCLMRCRTMTDKALVNRVKAIERAAGKHCVVKMAIFKSCLQDDDKWELAKLAGDALERLKALQPPPDN